MEVTTWITKDETPMSGLSSCNTNPMYQEYQQPQQYANVIALLQQQNFYVPAYADELGMDNFCMDDFFVSTAPPANNTQETAPDQHKTVVGLLATQPINIKTEEPYPAEWSQANAAYCHSPADSGVSMTASLSPNSEYSAYNGNARTDLESPHSTDSAYSISPAAPGTGAMTGTTGQQQNEVGFEIYHDLIMRHLVQDIKATCVRLNIPQDPKLWTPPDCRAWLTDMSAQYHLTEVPYDKFNVSGSTLCAMSLAQFNQYFPSGGETVHAQLQIWNSANDYCKRQSNQGSARSIIPDAINMIIPNSNYSMEQYKTADTGYMATQYSSYQTQQPQSQDQYVMDACHGYSLGALLPSPGSCSDSGTSADLETGNTPNSNCPNTNSNNIHLWQFLRELLDQSDQYSTCVRWVDQSAGVFKIEDSHKLARLWGQRKNRPAMNYDKLSRSLRQYYKKGILKKTTRSQRLIYQFLHPYNMC